MPEVKTIITEVISKDNVPARIVEVIDKYVEELDPEFKENPVFVRKSIIAKADDKLEIEPGERAAIRWVSTLDLDRDREILLPDGCRLSEFRKAPQVLWGHDYRMPPIGKDAWIKKFPKENPRGILAKTIYAKTPFAEQIWTLVRDGFLKTSSVGFIPLKSVRNGDSGFDKVCDKLEATYGVIGDRTKIRRIYTDWLMLEHSDVSVPANINALTVAVGKGVLNIDDEILRDLGVEKDDVEAASAIIKGVVPYEDLGIAAEDTEWNGAAEVASVEDMGKLKRMTTWYDSANSEVKSSYKLPHHRASDMKAVWKGVAAAMAALLGARGGVNLPANDRKGTYNHLAKHYAQFDKEAPPFKDYSDDELKAQFDDELWLSLWEDVLKPFPNEHACRINDPKKYSSFSRENNKFAPGIHAIWGIKEGKSELQSIRFDKSKYGAAEAKKWAEDHDYKCNPFEPAEPPKDAGNVEDGTPKVIPEPEIKVLGKVEDEKEPKVEPDVVVEEVKQTVVMPLYKEEPTEDIESVVEKTVNRKLGKV